jgi:hypothetical protein
MFEQLLASLAPAPIGKVEMPGAAGKQLLKE